MENKREETTPTGKKVEIVETPDGRKSVKIHVGSLDIKDPDTGDLKAKEIIEKQVLSKLNEHTVLAIIIHKPSNMKTFGRIPFTQVANYARNCIMGFPAPEGQEKNDEDFVIVVVDGENVETHSVT